MAQLFFKCNREISGRPRKKSERAGFCQESPEMRTIRTLEDCQIPGADVSEAQSSNEYAMTEQLPKTRDDLLAFLDELGIKHSTKDHAPVFTVAESVSLRDEIPGGHTKNLFVKDKKDNFFLLTVEENATVDLKTVHTVIAAASKVSFGKPEKLMEFLGVIPGAVTAFGAINDAGKNVTFVLDADLMAHDVINCHPLSNDATTSIGSDDLVRFMEATGHQPLVLKVTA
jgi:Ala-tRNA(Pro) deacylase